MRGFLLFLGGLAITGIALSLSRVPGAVERLYGQGPGVWIPRSLSLLTGWAPVSVSALLFTGLGVWAVVRGVRGWKGVRTGDRSLGAALRSGLAWSAGVVGVLAMAFYLFWGLNYAREPLGDRLELRAAPEGSAGTLSALAAQAAARTNVAYLLLHDGHDDAGEPTALPFRSREVSRELETGWRRVAEALELPAVTTRTYGPVKTVGATTLLNVLDLAGVYSPFTGEAHVSGSLPAVALPATAAHEQAHQRGITRENEATFAGVLAAIHTDDPYTRYSGWARITRAVFRDLRRVDDSAFDARMSDLLPGVRRDWSDLIRWYRDNRSVAGPVASVVNDTYLRAHGVPGGVASYDRVTELLVAWFERNGGRLEVLPGLVPAVAASGEDRAGGRGSPAPAR